MPNGVSVFGQGVEEQDQDQQVKPVVPKTPPASKPLTPPPAPAAKPATNWSKQKDLTHQEFAQRIRTKYPKAYNDLSDEELTQKFLKKYPVYNDMVAARPWKDLDVTEKAEFVGKHLPGIFFTGAEAAMSGAEQAGSDFLQKHLTSQEQIDQKQEQHLLEVMRDPKTSTKDKEWTTNRLHDIQNSPWHKFLRAADPTTVAQAAGETFVDWEVMSAAFKPMEMLGPLLGDSAKARKALLAINAALGTKFSYDQFQSAMEHFKRGENVQGWTDVGGSLGMLAMPWFHHLMNERDINNQTVANAKQKASQTIARSSGILAQMREARAAAPPTPEPGLQPTPAEPTPAEDIVSKAQQIIDNAPVKKPYEEPAQIIQGRQPLSATEREQQRHDDRVTQVKQEIADEKQRRAQIAQRALHQGLDVEQRQLEGIQERRERELREGEAFRTVDQRAIAPLPGEVEAPKLTPMQDALGWLQEPPGGYPEQEMIRREMDRVVQAKNDATRRGDNAAALKLGDQLRDLENQMAKTVSIGIVDKEGRLEPTPAPIAPDLPQLARTEAKTTEALIEAQSDLAKTDDPAKRADIEKEIDENKKLLADVKQEKRAAQVLTTAKLPTTRAAGAALQGVTGNKSTLKTVTADIPVSYKVVEGSSLKPSHNPETFAKTPGYPEGVQERTYESDKDAQVAVIQHGQQYDPAFTINDSPGPEHGPPIVTPDGIVLGGNSRVMSTMRHYGEDGETYRKELAARAGQFGIDPDKIADMKNPILVRELTNPPDSIQDLRALGSDLNRTFTRTLSEFEKAVSAGKRISQETLDFVGSQLTEMGEGASLRDLLRDKPGALLEKLTNDGIISAQERNALVDAKTGALNETGKDFVERALLGAVIDDPVVLANAPKGILRKVEGALPSLAQIKARGEPWDITDYLKEALREHIAAASKGVSIQDHLEPATLGLFAKEPVHPITEAIARNLEESNSAGVRKAWGNYAEDASVDVKGQGGLGFFEKPEPWDSFNKIFHSKVRPDEWGTLGPAGEIELQRAEAAPTGKKLPDWIERGREETGAKAAQGRWFATKKELIDWYAKEAGPGALTKGVKLSAKEAEKYRVSNLPPDDPARRFSRDPDNEFFIPREIADRAKVIEPPPEDLRTTFIADLEDAFPNMPLHQLDAAVALVDARAKAVGLSTDDWLRRRNVRVESLEEHPSVPGATASVLFKDGQLIIRSFKSKNPSVAALVHEIGHIFRQDLSPQEVSAAEKAFGLSSHNRFPNGQWTTEKEEQFARSFEKWLIDGDAPTPELKGVFAKLKTWLTNIYQALKERGKGTIIAPGKKGTPLDITVSPEMDNLFRKMMGGQELEPTPPEPERAAPTARLDLKEMPEEDLRAAQKTLQSQLGRGLTRPARERIEAQKKPFDEELKRRGTKEPGEVDRSVIFPKDQFQSAIDALKKKKSPTTLFYTEDEEETLKFLTTAMGHLFENGYRDYESNAAKITELTAPWVKPYTRTAYDRALTEGKNTAQKKLGAVMPEDQRKKYAEQLGLFETHEAKNRRIELPPGVSVPHETKTTPIERPDLVRKEPYARAGTERRESLGPTPGRAEQPLGRQPLGAPGRGVRPAASGTRGGGVQETPGRGLRVVTAPTIDVPIVPSENPAVEPGEWKRALETANLPSNLPPPTVALSPDIEEKLILNGQPEVTAAALTALDKYHAVVMATSTGSGKMYMGSAMLAEKKPQFGLVLSPSDPVSNKWIEVAKGFGVDIKKLPKGGMPTEPGIYVGTYQTASKRPGVDKFKWDMMIADESQNARGWHGGTAAGNMVKTLGANSANVVYMSATPYQNVLEMGYMDKLGIWGKQGFESWAAKEFHTYKNPNTGKWVVPFNPRKLAALREELVRRGMQINLDRDMEGVQVHFSKVPLSDAEKAVQKNIVKAFKLAEDYFASRPGGDKMIMATKGNAVTFMKSYLERLKLPAIIEQARKTADAGWKNTFFSQTKAEIDEIYKFLRPADQYYGGEISKLLPKVSGLVETLKEAFGDDIVDYTGATNAKREEGLRAFNAGEKKHLVATYGAGGVGVGMHDEKGDAPRAVFYTGLPWSGVVFDQALGRHIRGGARSDILVHIPVTDSAAEINLMAKKIMPRLESLRAAISGVDKSDPMLKGMADIEALLDYGTFGNKNKTSIEELTDTAPEARAIKNIKELSPPDAEQAKNKPMRGERKKPMKPPETLYYKEPPEDLGEPKSNAADSADAVRRPYVPKDAEKDINDPRSLDWLNDINEQYLRMTQGTGAGPLPTEPPKKPPAPPDEVIGTKQIPSPGHSDVEYDIPNPQVMRSLHKHFKDKYQKLGLSDEDITRLAKLEGWKNLKIAELHTAPTVLGQFEATRELARLLTAAEPRYRRDTANTKYEKNEILHDFRNDRMARRRIFEALQRAHDPAKELQDASSEWTEDKKPFTPAELHAAQRIRDEILNPIIEAVRKVRPDIGLRWKYAPLVRQINELLPTLYPELNGNIPADLVEDFSLELRQATTRQPFSVHELKRASTPPKALDIDEVLDGYIPSMLRLKHYTTEARKAGVIINSIPEKTILREYAEKYTRIFFGVGSEYKGMDALNKTFSRTLANMVYSAALDLNPKFFLIHSLKVPWDVWSDLGTKYTATGYAGMTTQEGRELVARSGILMDTLYTIRKPKTTLGTRFSKFLHYGLQLSDQIDRGVAYIGGLEQAKDLGYFGPPEKVGKITQDRLDELTASGVDVEKGIMHAYSVVSRTNFMYTNGHVQMLIREHPILGKFKSFATRQIEFAQNIRRMAKEAKEAEKHGVDADRFAAQKAAQGDYGYVNARAKYRRFVFMTAALALGTGQVTHLLGYLLGPDVLFAENTSELIHKTLERTATEAMWQAWFKKGVETFVPGAGWITRTMTAPGAPFGKEEKKHKPMGHQPSRRKHVAHF